MDNEDLKSNSNDEADDEHSEENRSKENRSNQLDDWKSQHHENPKANILEPDDVKPKRGRGRPKGSKNKKKTNDADQSSWNQKIIVISADSSQANNSASSPTNKLPSSNISANEDEQNNKKSNNSNSSKFKKNSNSNQIENKEPSNNEEWANPSKDDDDISLRSDLKSYYNLHGKGNWSNRTTEQTSQKFIPLTASNNDFIIHDISKNNREESKDRHTNDNN